jgi:hypothetical protein
MRYSLHSWMNCKSSNLHFHPHLSLLILLCLTHNFNRILSTLVHRNNHPIATSIIPLTLLIAMDYALPNNLTRNFNILLINFFFRTSKMEWWLAHTYFDSNMKFKVKTNVDFNSRKKIKILLTKKIKTLLTKKIKTHSTINSIICHILLIKKIKPPLIMCHIQSNKRLQ